MPSKTRKKTTRKKQATVEKELAIEMRKLAVEMRKLKKLEFVKILNRPWKFLFFSFLKGLMVGFGSILGASVLVGLFIYILAQISVVPFVGDFVQDILIQLDTSQTTEENINDKSFIDQYNEAVDLPNS